MVYCKMVFLIGYVLVWSFANADSNGYWNLDGSSRAIPEDLGIHSGTSEVAPRDVVRCLDYENLLHGIITKARIYSIALGQQKVQPLHSSYPTSGLILTPTSRSPPFPSAMPTPTWSDASLEASIAKRMSTRDYSSSDVSDQLLSNVLWAAYGYTPHGRTIQPIDDSTIIYVCRQDAAYKYIPETQSLQLWKEGNYTYVGQYDTAPVKICLINDTDKTDVVHGMLEIGKVGQNIYLEAIALGLGTITTGGGVEEAETALELPANERSRIIMPLGFPSNAYDFSSAPHPSSNLPEVNDTGVSLELVLSSLNIATAWNTTPVTTQELSNLVWAAYGTSYFYDNVNGMVHRTVPSAYSTYPFKIYVVDELAAYEYDPSGHSLTKLVDGDKRQDIADASEQFVADAPLVLVAGSTRYNGAYIYFWDYEVGAIGQNVLLESTGLGLGSNMVEVSDPNAVEAALSIGYNLYHLFVMPIGHAEGPTPTPTPTPSPTPGPTSTATPTPTASGLEWMVYK